MKLINYGGKEDIKDKIEVSNGLPWGWKWVRLGSVSEINPSKKEITHISNELEVSFIPMDAVDEVKGEITNSPPTSCGTKTHCSKNRRIICQNRRDKKTKEIYIRICKGIASLCLT